MVKASQVIGLLMMIVTTALAAQDVIVTSEVEEKGKVGMPLKGTVTITHDLKEQVDENSFMLGDAPLEVEHLKEVQVAPNSPLTISIYTFTLMPDEAGLHELPQVKVTVGGKDYRSFATTYRVEEVKATPVTPGSSSSSSIVLRIEPLIVGDTPLYPGQRIKVGYRYIFNYSQDLKKEIVPLLEAKGFRKVGGKTQETKMSGKLVHLDVLQEVEAIEPGEYHFEPAKIQGRAWRKGRFGQKDLAINDSVAESEPVSITVLPFPKQNQPPSFNGAIGTKLSFDTILLTEDKLTVGDKMKLKLEFKGTGELASLPILDICCQPGMSGFFRLSDLPPEESLQGDAKVFIVEMRPLTDQAKEIPALEFSYFNPEKKSYQTVKSDPIPLEIAPLKEGEKIDEEASDQKQDLGKPPVIEEKSELPAIEIEGAKGVEEADLKNLPFGSPWVIYFIPFFIAGLLFQKHLREHLLKKQQEEKIETSRDLFYDALDGGAADPQFYRKLHRAFILRLYERGLVKNLSMTTDLLPDEGVSGDVKAFLTEIETKRFSGREEELGFEEINRAKKLFKEI